MLQLRLTILTRSGNNALFLESLEYIVARESLTLELRGLHFAHACLIYDVAQVILPGFLAYDNFPDPANRYVTFIGVSHFLSGWLLENDVSGVNLPIMILHTVVLVVAR
jgi:hypothetical protein